VSVADAKKKITRDEVQLGKMNRWGRLRAKGEPVTFSGSHRYLLARGDAGEERVGASNIGAFRLTHFFFVFFL
jgi:hypothetical protein